LTKPHKEEILFVPQKPYLVLGTLRDQIIYPHEKKDMDALGITDTHLEALLEIVDPARNITNEWKWDTVKDWFHAFSGGQVNKYTKYEYNNNYCFLFLFVFIEFYSDF
jgi:ABC-type uncharacterized transport system fused permease/ATPase subunit